MKKNLYKILLLIIPLLPLVGIGLIIMSVDSAMLSLLLFAIFLLSALTLILYCKNAIDNKRLEGGHLTIWLVSFFMFSNVAQLIYWFKYVRSS